MRPFTLAFPFDGFAVALGFAVAADEATETAALALALGCALKVALAALIATGAAEGSDGIDRAGSLEAELLVATDVFGSSVVGCRFI